MNDSIDDSSWSILTKSDIIDASFVSSIEQNEISDDEENTSLKDDMSSSQSSSAILAQSISSTNTTLSQDLNDLSINELLPLIKVIF